MRRADDCSSSQEQNHVYLLTFLTTSLSESVQALYSVARTGWRCWVLWSSAWRSSTESSWDVRTRVATIQSVTSCVIAGISLLRFLTTSSRQPSPGRSTAINREGGFCFVFLHLQTIKIISRCFLTDRSLISCFTSENSTNRT